MEIYKTSDLALATALSVRGVEVEGLENSGTSRVIFLFKNTPELKGLLESYWNKTLLVEPQEYFSRIRSLKSRIS